MSTETPWKPPVPTCSCCGLRPGIGVASSPFLPVSYSYCRECLVREAEPLVEIVDEELDNRVSRGPLGCYD